MICVEGSLGQADPVRSCAILCDTHSDHDSPAIKIDMLRRAPPEDGRHHDHATETDSHELSVETLSRVGPHLWSLYSLVSEDAAGAHNPNEVHAHGHGATYSGDRRGESPTCTDNAFEGARTRNASPDPSSTTAILDWLQREHLLYKMYWSTIHPLWPVLYRPAINDASLRATSPILHHAIIALACSRALTTSDEYVPCI